MLGVVAGLLCSLIRTFVAWSAFRVAGSPDCNEGTNSWVYCDPSRYFPELIVWGAIFLLFLAGTFYLARLQRKTNAKTNSYRP